jgi:hypothetical protein
LSRRRPARNVAARDNAFAAVNAVILEEQGDEAIQTVPARRF